MDNLNASHRLVNLTPHPITILPSEGSELAAANPLPIPSAGVARVDGLPLGPVVGLDHVERHSAEVPA